ncbi:MAG: chemotaxis response regulator protein-glutamate methylesterase [Opitutaceae bacterium]|nr:chemotaxis response regulator protein-glutamate methylesterase [Opitutaceae bacterium]
MIDRKLRVLIVDDSAVVRKAVNDALAGDPEIDVVGTAMDPYVAREKILTLRPDVLTLDIEMPRMDGLTFLRILMAERPMPVVILSSLTTSASQQALEALRLGAIEVLGKPSATQSMSDLAPRLRASIKAAASARLNRPALPLPRQSLTSRIDNSTTRVNADAGSIHPGGILHPPDLEQRHDPRSLVLLGASTGGTEALREILTQLPSDFPPMAIVQHIPAVFSRALAERLDAQCRLEVREAADGDRLTPGVALIAPGDRHMLIDRESDGYRVRVVGGPPIWFQRPAVDLLFRSAAAIGGGHVVAGVLTGMGRDGAEGLLHLRERGALTFSQDEESSAVYGMPRAAWELGGSQHQVALTDIPSHLISLVNTEAAVQACSPSSSPSPLPAHASG